MLLMAFLLLFMGMPIYAAEEISSKEASPENPVTFSQPSLPNQQGEDTKKEVHLEKEEEKQETPAQDAVENNLEEKSKDSPEEAEATKEEEKEIPKEKDQAQEQGPKVEAEDKAEAAEEKTPKADPATDPDKKPVKAPEEPAQGEKASGEETGQEPKESKPQVDPKENEDLKNLQDKIKTEKDPKKKATLQKEYNEKYLEKLEKDGQEKLNPDVINRFKDKERIAKYNEIQEQYDKIKKAKLDGSLTQADIDKLNALLGSFNPPRELSKEEKDALDKLHDEPYIPGVKEKDNELFKNYEDAKKALEDALNPENKAKTKEDFDDLIKKFNEAKTALKEAIDKGEVHPKFTEGKGPEIKLFPLDGVKPGDEMKDDTYYLPDNTDMHLLIQFNKDAKENGEKQELEFTIKPEEAGVNLTEYDVQKLVFLNYKDQAKNVAVVINPDGSYTFKTSVEFGVAQLRFNTKGFKAAFHKGFKLVMKAGDTTVEKKFLITKKGYDDADIGSIGTDEKVDAPTIDAGDTNENIVDADTKKVFDVFTMIKKTDAYIDDVFINSGNGESQELSSVEITIKMPKYNGDFAKYIHDSGLDYQDNDDGTYTLKLQMKDFGGNLKKDAEGNLTYKGNKLEKAELTDIILEEAGKKVYIDKDGKAHDITSEEYYEVTDYGKTFRVIAGKIYKKTAENKFEQLNEFEDGKFKDGDTIYQFIDGKLVSYTSEEDAYEGNVSNKDDKADPDVTPTYDGDQVIVKEGETEYYGGTIIKDGIFDKDGKKYLGKNVDKDYKGYEVAYIDETGKVLLDEAGNPVTNLTEEQKETFTPAFNAIFKDGYIQAGMTFKKDYTLIDKFGKVLDDITVEVEDNVYKFTKNKGKENQETKKVDDDKITIDNEKSKFVDKDNKVLDKSNREAIVGKYYFYGQKFVKIKNEDGLKGDKYYVNYKPLKMEFKKTYSYDKDGQIITIYDKTKIYQGSINLENYVAVDDKIYEKKSIGGIDYYININPEKDDEILSEKTISRIVQTLKIKDANGNLVEVEKVTDETSIYEAVTKSKFKIKFPGFLAGDQILYNLGAEIKAYYKAPDPETNELKDISIFKDKQGKPIVKDSEQDKSKSIKKYFKLKVKESSQGTFFKNPPKELLANPDYNFFNVFYRDETDRSRDDFIKSLLKLDKNEEERVKPKNKEKLDILNIIQSELARLYNGAKFDLDDKDNLLILDKEGKEAKDITRKLLWEVGFNNKGGALFPENKDNTIVITDSNMDNRLVYDEIIVNDEKETWKKAKEDWEKKEAEKKKANPDYKEEKFPGTEEYFFIDQIDEIQLGVNSAYKDKVFTAVYKLTKDEILKELGDKESVDYEKDGITYKITRDKDKGQIRIKVLKAFYKKVNGADNKFESPVQKEYKEKTKNLISTAEALDESSKENFKKAFTGLVGKLYNSKQECYGVLTEKFGEIIGSLKDNDPELAKKLDAIKTAIVEEVKRAALGYLDGSKGDYKFDDMSFNAIRVKFKPGLTVGGAMEKVKTKKLGITSVIVPDVEVPYTDEFGNLMTNKGKYLYEAIKEIQKDKKLSDDDFNAKMEEEVFYREVMKAAYEKVNARTAEKAKDKITIKDLVKLNKDAKYGEGKFKVIAGNSENLSFDDLAIDGKALKDKNGEGINPFYIGDADKDGKVKSLADKVSPELQEKDAYKKLAERPIDLAAYYLNSMGYNRAFYENKAEYFLLGGNAAAGIFEKENNWREKICYHGILGHCVENAGKEVNPDEYKKDAKAKAGMNSQGKFTIDYTPSPKTPDEEHPGVDKKSDTSVVDISKEKDTDTEVDFTIDVTVDKMNKDQKELSDALKEDSEKSNFDGYKENGYYEYKNGLIIDILPDIFEIGKNTKIELEINEKALKANGANKDVNIDEFKSKVEYAYIEDVKAYYDDLVKKNDKRAKVLAEYFGGDMSKVKAGQRAVLAWLPDFEAPHGEKNQFRLKLTKLLLNKEKYKEYEKNNNYGQDYTNESGFGDKAKFWYGSKTITVTDGHSGDVNKYLQIFDKNGKELDEETASEWFKGSVTLKFGDKFNYKIKYHNVSEIIDTGLATTSSEWSLDDLFNEAEKDGLRPVLRDFVIAPEGFDVLYKIGEEYKKASEIKKEDLAKVTAIKMTSGDVGFPANEIREFILPMMIPNLDAKIENGKLIYIGTDGEKHEIGDAKEFFNLPSLMDKDKKMSFENKVDGSNTVTVYLEKERFIKVFKEFLDANGEKLKNLDNLEAKFDIYQIIKDEKGNIVKKVKLDKQLIANKENDFTDMVDHLPIFKKTTTIGKDGKVTVTEVKYDYELKEVPMDGFEGKVWKLDDSDGLGFVWQAKNTEKPEKPENPPEEPKNPPEEPKNPPEEPETPPETPEKPEKSEYPNKEDVPEKPETGKVDQGKNYPKTPDKSHGKNNLPKTGLVEDLSLLYLSGLAFVVLLFLRRKKFAR